MTTPASMFFQDGTNIRTMARPSSMTTELPAGVFAIRFDPQAGTYYYEQATLPPVPKKMYGSVEGRAEKVLNTFKDRNKSTGALFDGLLGTGKSQISMLIANQALAEGIPVLLIRHPHAGEEFNKFLGMLNGQRVVIIIDEFEKVYNDKEDENRLLTLMDGTGNVNALWLLTANDRASIGTYMKNRPSRIFYNYHYGSLDFEIAAQVMTDHGCAHLVQELKGIYHQLSVVTFDIINSIAQECNRYGLTIAEAVRDMSIEFRDPEQPMRSVEAVASFKGIELKYTSIGTCIPGRVNRLSFYSNSFVRPEDAEKLFEPLCQLVFAGGAEDEYDDDGALSDRIEDKLAEWKQAEGDDNARRRLWNNLVNNMEFTNLQYSHVDEESGNFMVRSLSSPELWIELKQSTYGAF